MTNIGTLFYLLWVLGTSLVSFYGHEVALTPPINEDRAGYDTSPKTEIVGSLPVNCVVIDAGHGGHDVGCSGSAINEKEVTLGISLALGEELQHRYPEMKIIHTRTSDRFIPLHERIGLANRERADLFISIHANAFEDPEVGGTEVYVMGLHAARENLEVAQRENQAILLEKDFAAHYGGFDPHSAEAQIILSMYQNNFLEQSINLASLISDQMGAELTLVNRGVRQAGFVILREATMPSVLIEAGYLSHIADEQMLRSARGQKNIARAIANAVTIYRHEAIQAHYEQKWMEENRSGMENAGNGRRTKEGTIFYSIQLVALSPGSEIPSFTGLPSGISVQIILEDGLKKVLLGPVYEKQKALEIAEEMARNGYSGAFIRATPLPGS